MGKPARTQSRGENTPVQFPALRWVPRELISTTSSLYTKPVTVYLFGKNQGCSHCWLEDAVYDLWPKVMKYTTCRNQRKHIYTLSLLAATLKMCLLPSLLAFVTDFMLVFWILMYLITPLMKVAVQIYAFCSC